MPVLGMARVERIALRNKVSYTVINVKPYWVIICRNKILCEGERELPMVFDTKALADLCKKDNRLRGCKIKEMELEELARMCRDGKIHFDSFVLIDKASQLGID